MAAPARINERFEVRRVLGAGAAATVLEVFDPFSESARALKLAGGKSGPRRFREEFRRLTRLRHPNVVRAYDFGCHEGRPFYTMELVEGVSLREFLPGAGPAVVGVIAMQLLDALTALHARGVVHRDVKPDNVLVVGQGTAALARLIDFGLSVRVGSRGKPAGSLPYVAPEVARSRPVDGRADLYSLGVLLYEALLPSGVAATLEEVALRLSTVSTPLHDHNPSISRRFSDVIAKLMHPDPAQRFHTAHEASEALAAHAPMELGTGPKRAAMERLVRGGAACHRPTLIRSVTRLAREVASDGAGRAVVLEGPVGVGKTPVLREIGVNLALSGFRLVHLPVTREPASPATRLLRLLARLGEDTSDLALGRPVEAARAVVRLLGSEPTALLVDDLQDAEPAAVEVFRALVRRLDRAPILLVAATESIEVRPSLAGLFGERAVAHPLRPLRRSAVRALVEERLHGIELPDPALRRISADCEGLPGRVERTLAQLLVDETIVGEAQGYRFIGGRYRPADPHESAAHEVALEELSAAQRPVLWAAAVLGWYVDAERVAHVACVPVQEADRVLAELVRAELLMPAEATRRATYRFANKALHSAVYATIPQTHRRALHDRAADAVSSGRRAGIRREERAEHLLKGSDDDLAIQAALEAGDRAASSFSDRLAIEYYARAFARIADPEDPRAAPTALRLGRLFERTGELERASAWYEAAAVGETTLDGLLGVAGVALLRGLPELAQAAVGKATRVPDRFRRPEHEVALLRLEARIAMQAGRFLQASRVLERAVAQARSQGLERSAVANELVLDQARAARQRGNLLDTVRFAKAAGRLAKQRGDGTLAADARILTSQAFLRGGRLEGAHKSLRLALDSARAIGDRMREATVLRETGHVRFLDGDLRGALESYERALELVRASQARLHEALVLHDLGRVRGLCGSFGAAYEALRAARIAAWESGDARSYIKALLGHALTAAVIGDDETLSEALERVRTTSRTITPPVMMPLAIALDAQWRVSRDPGGATKRLEDFELLSLPEDRSERVTAWLVVIRVLLALGRREDAQKRVAQCVDEIALGGLEHLRVESLILRARSRQGRLGDALGDLAEAEFLARERGLRPGVVEALETRGALLEGEAAGVEATTRAMEELRDLASATPAELGVLWLASPLPQRLRARFWAAAERLGVG